MINSFVSSAPHLFHSGRPAPAPSRPSGLVPPPPEDNPHSVTFRYRGLSFCKRDQYWYARKYCNGSRLASYVGRQPTYTDLESAVDFVRRSCDWSPSDDFAVYYK